MPITKSLRNLVLDQSYTLKKSYMRRRFLPPPGRDLRHRDMIWIYSVGKAGTTALHRSLAERFPPHTVYQFHFLSDDNLSVFESIERKAFFTTNAVFEHSMLGRYFNSQLKTNQLDLSHIRVMTAFRDPVAGQIASFFENLYRDTGIAFQKLAAMSVNDCARLLTEIFCRKFLTEDIRLRWFDTELKQTLGVDVYARPFPKEKGFAVFQDQHPPVLVIKTEKMNDCAEAAVGAFLGIESFKLMPANVGSEKRYGHIYKRFKEMIRLPEDYLDKMYGSRFVRHFYTDAEIGAFRSRWQHQAKFEASGQALADV